MSLHAEMIRSTASRSSIPSLLEGAIVTSTLAVVSGFAAAALYAFNQGIVPAVLVLTSAAGMGLICGLVARFELPGRSAMIRWWVAMFGLVVGMIPQGWLSGGTLGINLDSFALFQTDIDGLLRLSVGAVAAWLAVRAWSQRPTPQTTTRANGGDTRSARSQAVLSDPVDVSPNTRQPSSSVRATHTSSLVQPNTRRRSINIPRLRFGRQVSKKRMAVRARRRRIQSAIRLTEHVEHRCPFCLELVEGRSARGSVECPTCHTLHHADCWAVTGTCQVPHHNS